MNVGQRTWRVHVYVESGRPSLLMVFYFKLITLNFNTHNNFFLSPTSKKPFQNPLAVLGAFKFFLSFLFTLYCKAIGAVFFYWMHHVYVCRLHSTIISNCYEKISEIILKRESTWFFWETFPCLLFTKKIIPQDYKFRNEIRFLSHWPTEKKFLTFSQLIFRHSSLLFTLSNWIVMSDNF